MSHLYPACMCSCEIPLYVDTIRLQNAANAGKNANYFDKIRKMMRHFKVA